MNIELNIVGNKHYSNQPVFLSFCKSLSVEHPA